MLFNNHRCKIKLIFSAILGKNPHWFSFTLIDEVVWARPLRSELSDLIFCALGGISPSTDLYRRMSCWIFLFVAHDSMFICIKHPELWLLILYIIQLCPVNSLNKDLRSSWQAMECRVCQLKVNCRDQ